MISLGRRRRAMTKPEPKKRKYPLTLNQFIVFCCVCYLIGWVLGVVFIGWRGDAPAILIGNLCLIVGSIKVTHFIWVTWKRWRQLRRQKGDLLF